MGSVKDINIKNRNFYFYDDMINNKNFDSSLLKIDIQRGCYLLHWIYHEKDKYAINSVNPLYLIVHEVNGFIEEKDKYAEIWSEIKDQIKAMNNGKSGEYGKDYMKIKFNLDDDLTLNKQLKFINLTIIVRTVFEEDGKYYPPIFLDECLYKL